MTLLYIISVLMFVSTGISVAQQENYLSFQYPDNPPMQVISRTPPEPENVTGDFEIRKGFTLIKTLDEFREVIKKDNRKIRMKPGIYRPVKVDEPMKNQEHIFAVNGSNNHFDLRGVVFETTVSLQGKLTGKAHVADCWHINGSGNTFEGGYFRNVVDKPYPNYRVAENEFEICGDNNTFLNCIFVIKGSVPYGYSDFYGKGGPNFGRLNKHSFMSISHADNTRIIGCKVYMKSFGHCIHFHTVDGVLIKDCCLTGTLRSTNDIYKEKVGRAVEYDFNIMYRGKRPIPSDQVIPLTEDGIRAYEEVKNVTVINTTVERFRGCFQLLCVGDVTLENVTVQEAGDFSYDISSGAKGKVVMKNCRGDIAYNPLFNLTRGDTPKDAFYEITIVDSETEVTPTERTGFGTICGVNCTFVFHDGTTRPVPRKFNVINCGGRKPLKNSTVTNFTTAKMTLNKSVTSCTIKSIGPVEDHGSGNTIIRISAADRKSDDAVNIKPSPKPLYRDPVYDGAADPVVIWNPHVKAWWMFYTNRRAKMPGLSGVAWVHGTEIGIAQLNRQDSTWAYTGISKINDGTSVQRPTHWAPEVITDNDGLHHMFLTVVPGVFENWNHPRSIVHLTSRDLRNWSNPRKLNLASDRVIDACVIQLDDGIWRMWYNNERDRKSIYYAQSPDLEKWTDKGKAVGDQSGEGPKVFRWKGYFWMVTDVWQGLAVYKSTDAMNWTRQPYNLVQKPGTGKDDKVKGGHPDVVVNNDRAYLFYFTHPGRQGPDANKDTYEQRRSSIQVAELEYKDAWLACDRNKPTYLKLNEPD